VALCTDSESALASKGALRMRIEPPEEMSGLLQEARERSHKTEVSARRRKYQLGRPWESF
jgi:hypothetical protein